MGIGGRTTRQPVAGALWATLLAVSMVAACGHEAPPPSPPEAAAPAPKAPPRPRVVDGYGNLAGGGDVVLGFELPLAAKVVPGAAAKRTIKANRDALVRYFKTRDYELKLLSRGGLVTHTERSLRRVDEATRDKVAKASIFITAGKDGAYELLFDDGAAVIPPPRALDDLIAMERALDAKNKAAAGAPAGAGEETKPKAAPHALMQYVPRVPPSPAEVKRLKGAALGPRPRMGSHAKNVSRRIYEWAKEHPSKPFLD